MGAEAAFAGLARKPLDTSWLLKSPEVANLFEGPGLFIVGVVQAVRVWAVGRSPSIGDLFCGFHVWPTATSEPDTFSEAQPAGREGSEGSEGKLYHDRKNKIKRTSKLNVILKTTSAIMEHIPDVGK